MKLPRGTFHSIKKGILFRSLLDEIEKTRFTGYCTITSGIETCTLVLNSGIYIIADYGKLEGEHAWQKMQKMLDMKVDAGLTTLNPVQLDLAREFNPHAALPSFVRRGPARQVRTGVTTPDIRKKEGIPGDQVPEVRFEPQGNKGLNDGTETVLNEKPAAEQVSTSGTAQSPGEQPANENGHAEDGTSIGRDLDALDNMDIDEMTKKIRENCKVTIEHLDLDHLIDKRED